MAGRPPSVLAQSLQHAARRFWRHAGGSIEFGTMLLALVGVMAAGAGAAFVVDSAMEMGQKGTATATQAAENQGSALKVLEVRGERDATGLVRLRELVAAEGAPAMLPISTLLLRFDVNAQTLTFAYSPHGKPGTFTVEAVRDADGSLRGAEPVLDDEDLAELVVELGPAGAILDASGSYTQVQSAPGARTTEAKLTVGSGAAGTTVRLL